MPPRVLAVLRLLLGSLALAAIGWQLSIHLRLGLSVVNFFSYFTNLANLLASMLLVALAVWPATHDSERWHEARWLSAVNMAVVGIVFALLLRDADLGALRPWVNNVLHYLMPVAVVLDWLAFPPRRPLARGVAFTALILPTLYLAYTLVRGAAIDWYPYPFLDPAKAGGAGAVALYALGIAVTFLLLALALVRVGPRTRTVG
jgi:hypothetical protein